MAKCTAVRDNGTTKVVELSNDELQALLTRLVNVDEELSIAVRTNNHESIEYYSLLSKLQSEFEGFLKATSYE